MSDQAPKSGIYAVTPAKKMSQEEIANTFAPEPEVEENQAVEHKPSGTLNMELPQNGLVAKRRKLPKGQRFTDKHSTISLTVSNEIYADAQAFLDAGGEKYGNRTVFADLLFRALLKENGWPGY